MHPFVSFVQINRLEGQVSRYKASADNAEKVEDELKAEKRKLQREVKTRKCILLCENLSGLSVTCSPLFPHSCAQLLIR